MKRLIAILTLCIFLFGGCSENTSSGMFALPEMPEMQKALIDTVDTVLGGGGFVYSEPRSGLNRQSLQLMDLDGDGEEEGIAFLRDVQQTYKTFIYIFEKDENGFVLFDIIEGSENELYTVSYSDILGKNGYEIIVEWGADGDGSHPITVYNLVRDGTEKILEISARQYSVSDLDGDGKNDFTAVVKRGGDMYADVYTSQEDTLVKNAQIALSRRGGELLRIKTGNAMQGKGAVFIEREMGDGVITDVVSYNGEEFVNLLPDGDVCMSRALCADVNGDGVIEIPKETDLVSDFGTTTGCYTWSSLSEKGALIQSAFTYHSFEDNWFLSMPLSWSGSVYAESTSGRSGENAIHFSTRERMGGDDEEYIEAPLFTLYVLTGGRRSQYAAEGERFVVSEREDTIFAAEIISESYLATKINEDFIKSIFKNSESEWFSEILFA